MIKGRRVVWVPVVVLAVVASLALVSAGTAGVIHKRQAAMEQVGKAMGGLAAIAKKEAPFDAEVVKKHASAVAEHLKKSAGLFPEGSQSGEAETWAKAEVWTDRETFDKGMQSAVEAAVALGQVTEADAFGPALGKLGNGCKGCHSTFRRPKE
jgi:cytochrome c556